MSTILGIFAKQPIAGQVKTRLARDTTDGWAQRVAEACLEDSLDRFVDCGIVKTIVYTPAHARDYFEELSRGRYELMAQVDGDLGQRLRGFFEASSSFERRVAIGSDSPTLPVQFVQDAFTALETHDAVLGPACDGGYYLIGTRKDLPLFNDIPWSTNAVLEKTIERLRSVSATVALLPPWYDVDTMDDWALLRGHVLAMRQAGIDPGVTRLEQLIREQTS